MGPKLAIRHAANEARETIFASLRLGVFALKILRPRALPVWLPVTVEGLTCLGVNQDSGFVLPVDFSQGFVLGHDRAQQAEFTRRKGAVAPTLGPIRHWA